MSDQKDDAAPVAPQSLDDADLDDATGGLLLPAVQKIIIKRQPKANGFTGISDAAAKDFSARKR